MNHNDDADRFTEIARRVAAGDIDHAYVADLLVRGTGFIGVSAGPTLDKLRAHYLADLQARYPTHEALLAHMHAMVAAYRKAAGK